MASVLVHVSVCCAAVWIRGDERGLSEHLVSGVSVTTAGLRTVGAGARRRGRPCSRIVMAVVATAAIERSFDSPVSSSPASAG